MKRNTVFSLCVLVLLSGCALVPLHPTSTVPDKISESGIALYNKTKISIPDSEWRAIASYVDLSYRNLLVCIGEPLDHALKERIRKTPVVLIPGKPLFLYGEEKQAVTNLEYIFVRRDKISNPRVLLHERIHIYLYYANKRVAGDFFHRDSLFEKCKKSVF